ncbi:hypothetical protein R9C00_16860 [Flammeovirgaceae bacterium SG7u.111]|nr:hypothetical protein [Flammeovirgaceae bacterium SG7u.132]WPO33371.1 hypothetical protein R9C00_16860 [Flammeovirgaceae bacterium SG7u.111]
MKNHQFNLIDNTYSVNEAKELLLTLINDKVKFLDMHMFSLNERYGADTAHLTKRVKELKASRAELIEVLRKLENDQHFIDINCAVQLTINEVEVA